MKSVKKSVICIILSVFISSFSSTDIFAATKMKAVAISGGEVHTLILGENGQAFACGRNGMQSFYGGVLGTGSYEEYYEADLVRVHGPNSIGFFDSIDDIDAGWLHSLALDVNGCV